MARSVAWDFAALLARALAGSLSALDNAAFAGAPDRLRVARLGFGVVVRAALRHDFAAEPEAG